MKDKEDSEKRIKTINEMNYGNIKFTDIADGPGVRVTLFVSGCHLKCAGCQNKIAQDFNYGQPFTESVLDTIKLALNKNYIAGFTLCGGEPFSCENQKICAHIVEEIKKTYPTKSIWCYTGYYLDTIPRTSSTQSFLENIDVLIEGPYIAAKRDISDNNRWRGSTNQHVINMSESLKEHKRVYLDNIPNNKGD